MGVWVERALFRPTVGAQDAALYRAPLHLWFIEHLLD